MRIGLDARFLDGKTTGISKYSEQLITALSQADDDNEYIVIVNPAYNSQLPLGDNFSLVTYDAPPLSIKTVYRLSSFLDRYELDLFHSFFPLAPLFFNGALLITIHDIQPFVPDLAYPERDSVWRQCSSLFYQWMFPRILKRANWLIAVSEATKNYTVELFPFVRDKVLVVHSGLGEEWFEPLPADLEEETAAKYNLPGRFLFYEGSGRPCKNVNRMLRAFSLMIRERNDLQNVSFVLCLHSDAYVKDIKGLISRLGLGEKAMVLTNVGGAELKALYHRALLLAFVTKYEGFGFPVLQAQAVGTPVLASNSAALPEITRNSALLVDPDNENEIAAGLIQLLSDQSLYQALVHKGGENARRYSWLKTADRLMEVYQHLT